MIFLRPSHLESGKALSLKPSVNIVFHGEHHLPARSIIKTPTKTQHLTQSKTQAASGLFAATPSWSQDFNSMSSGALSSSIWDYNLGNGAPDNPGWGNDEDEYYTNNLSNVRISNGQLIIEAPAAS
jgi:hypothetical protein